MGTSWGTNMERTTVERNYVGERLWSAHCGAQTCALGRSIGTTDTMVNVKHLILNTYKC